MKKNIARILTLLVISSSIVVPAAASESTADVIMNTGTTQAFTDEAVSAEDLETILQAGLITESAINQQPWFFVALTNNDLMEEIAGAGMSFAPPAGGNAPDAPKEGPDKPAPSGDASKEGPDKPAPSGDASKEAPDKPAPSGDAPKDAPAMPAPAGGAKAGLGDSPLAIIVYRDDNSKSPNADFDCGLATQNMVLAASSLGYGVKIVSSPTMALNGENHDALCEKLGVDPGMQAVAVLLIGYEDNTVDGSSSASTRDSLEDKTNIVE